MSVNTVRRWASNLRMRQSRSRPEIADRNASWSSLLRVVITPEPVVCLVPCVAGAALAVAFAVGCGDAVGGAARAVVGCSDAVVASVASRGAVGAVVELGAGSWAQARIMTAYRARMAVNTLRAAGVIRLIMSPRSVVAGTCGADAFGVGVAPQQPSRVDGGLGMRHLKGLGISRWGFAGPFYLASSYRTFRSTVGESTGAGLQWPAPAGPYSESLGADVCQGPRLLSGPLHMG